MKKFFIPFLAIVLLSFGSFGQSQIMLYQLNSRLPQANQINPGLFPDYKVSIGLPVLSSTYITANAGKLSFNNAFSTDPDGTRRFDPQKLASELNETNRIEVNANAMLFYLGLRLNKNYFSIALNERVDGGITYPKTFVELLASGNGEAGTGTIAFENFGLRAYAYHELAIGYGRDITEKLSIGVRAKFLSGIVNVDVENISAGLTTSLDSLYLYSSAFNINTAGSSLLDDANVDDIFKAATAFNNTGFALDLGAHYWVTDKFRVSISATDIGSLKWKNDTRQFRFNEVRYSFKGLDFIEVLDPDKEISLDSELDSLQNMFKPDTLDGIAYSTNLSPKIYAGASYHLGKSHTFGALLYGDVFKGTFNPAFGLSYNLTLGHIWTIGVNASYRNSSFSNIGLGTTLTLGPVQIYALTENVMSFAQLSDASFVDARFGLNLVFGKIRTGDQIKVPKEKKKKSKEDKSVAPKL